jgi:hypothetical protein
MVGITEKRNPGQIIPARSSRPDYPGQIIRARHDLDRGTQSQSDRRRKFSVG